MSETDLTKSGIGRLIEQLGPGRVELSRCKKSDYELQAEATVYVETEDQIRTVMRWASTEGVAVIPQGKGAWATYGNPVFRRSIIISLIRMNGIVEHSAGDLTVTVQPGTELASLQKHLKEKRQMLPLDPGWPEHATVGGIVATGFTGPKRLKYGLPRDWVIGMRMVLADGRTIRTGGKVVKNVAGYDMNKLFVGSMGTLGIITECTFKLRPVPPAEAALILEAPNTDVIRGFCYRVFNSSLEPTALEMVNTFAMKALLGSSDSGCGLVIGFEDEAKAVSAEQSLVAKWAKEEGLSICTALEKDRAAQVWERLRRLTPNVLDMDDSRIEVSLKGVILPEQVAESIQVAGRLAEQQGIEAIVHGGIGTGIIRVIMYAPAERLQAVCDSASRIRSWVEERSGHLVVEHAPLSFKERISVWGRPPGGLNLMRQLKERLDPGDLLNPGRFVGGI
ncbi:FAD-binding oxidoreductase [Paenactinomyces guangxiensis]|uniref:FAD-binding oxidoreductase n=1 Tax=Paenactinomyces guangxiensis TaxID=1490290 RepID=A0A7W2A9F8_9BACL|nr:FAD-binding oxidoreductase [Paenactinomyces guangxiensis]MBA4495137.1 FAD-binding oxidoreductase [Paenactinomyces guangxiensis]MBH8592179.1 FAD-binding oxidoreductase [Paenactinomyces guangxiensis]